MNILIIGLGSIAKKHISVIRKLYPQAVIEALRSSANAEIYEGVQNVLSLSDIKTKPDFIIISNPTILHEKSITDALEFNCPLFIEKPVLSSLKNADIIISEQKRRQVITYIACNMRFHPALKFLKQYIDSKKPRINEVSIYCGSYLPDWRPGRDFKTTYSAIDELGGGVHLDLIHELDYCMWIFGFPERVQSLKKNTSSLGINAVDYAHYTLIYDRFAANINLNYFRVDSRRVVEILFEDATWTVDLLKCEIKDDKGTMIFSRDYKIADTYIDQMRYFIDGISNGGSMMNDITEAVEVLKVCLSDECTER